jgi:hypothetical protein
VGDSGAKSVWSEEVSSASAGVAGTEPGDPVSSTAVN